MTDLDNLLTEPLGDSATSISTAEGLRMFLSGRAEVVGLRRALAAEVIGPEDVREFIEQMVQSFVPGRRFAKDYAVAAIAVALETHPAPFAEEFLSVLARVTAAEVPLAPRVARLSLRERRKQVADLTTRALTFEIPAPIGPPTLWTPPQVGTPSDESDYRIRD